MSRDRTNTLHAINRVFDELTQVFGDAKHVARTTRDRVVNDEGRDTLMSRPTERAVEVCLLDTQRRTGK